MSALIEDLHQRGLDRHVLFIFCGEFGRTPRIEYQDASRRPGRDHWTRAMSIFLAGGGLRMGQVVGKSNARGEYPVDRPVKPQDVTAMVFHHLGIDASSVSFPDSQGRGVALVENGRPIRELLR